MRVARWGVALLIVALVAGCVSGRSLDQSIAAGLAAARFHSANGTWPKTREELLTFNDERLSLRLHKNDQVWLRQNTDGSAVITWLQTGGWGASGTSVHVMPPSRPSTSPQNNAQSSAADDYTVVSAKPSKSFGRPLE